MTIRCVRFDLEVSGDAPNGWGMRRIQLRRLHKFVDRHGIPGGDRLRRVGQIGVGRERRAPRIGRSMVHRLWGSIEQAETVDRDATRLETYEPLRLMVAGLRLPVIGPDAAEY